MGMRRNQEGYTLIELLLYISILGMLLGSLSLFFGAAVSARVKNQTILEVNTQATNLMDYMTQTVRNASSITSPTSGTNAATMTVAVPTGSLTPTVFSLVGSPATVQVKEGVATAIPLTNNKVQISSLTFKNLSWPSTPGTVQISFVASRVNPSNRNEYEYQKTFTSSAEVAW